MKKIVYSILFIVLTPINLILSFFTLFNVANKPTPVSIVQKTQVLAAADYRPQLYAVLPENAGIIDGEAVAADARPMIVEKYLKKYKSPITPYYQDLIRAADKYQVNPFLIVAIGQCESNLCKRHIPGSYNCWGFENGETRFLSWRQAFESVAKTLRTRYLDYGLDTPEEIMPKYAPPSVEKGGPWARCVSHFMEDLESGRVE